MAGDIWRSPTWAHLRKHQLPGGKKKWAAIRRGTAVGDQVARFKFSEAVVRPLGMQFVRYEAIMYGEDEPVGFEFRRDIADDQLGGIGISNNGNGRKYYVSANGVIGASLGQDTRIILIKRSRNGPTHGYPVTKRALIDELRDNDHELTRFLDRWRNEKL